MRLLLALLLAAGCTSAERPTAPPEASGPLPPGAYHVLPASQASAAGAPCSRDAPAVEGGWAVTEADAQAVERLLPTLADTPPAHPNAVVPASSRINLAASVRQYVGVVVGGRRLVYVNAFPRQILDGDTLVPPDQRHHPGNEVVGVCDGGAGFWGVVFDPATAQFSGLAFNGGF